MAWIDSLISFFSPEWGARRQAWRNALDEIRNYDAGNFGRLNAGWRVFNESAEMTDRNSCFQLLGPAALLVKEFVVIEHHTITNCQLPLRQGIRKLQIDIIIEYIPAFVRILLSGHQIIALNTQHHRQSFGEQRRIQFDEKQRQFVG